MIQLSRIERERLAHEQAMIECAERLFYIVGYAETSMDQLAKAAEYSKKTIYRYFVNKEDLYYAVILNGQKRMQEYVEEQCEQVPPGPEKLRTAVQASRDFFKKNGPLFELLSQIKAVGRGRTDTQELPYCKKYMDYVGNMTYRYYFQVFREAAESAPFRPRAGAEKTAFSALFMVMAFFQMYAIAGDAYVQYFGLDKDEFIDLSMNMLFSILYDGDFTI